VADTSPETVLGDGPEDIFSTIIGATRVADDRFMVGDAGTHALHLYTSNGALIGSFARRGAGPGELQRPLELQRCGDTLLLRDGGGARRISLFSLDGQFVRSFRPWSPETFPPYRTVCNNHLRLAHHGWGDVQVQGNGVSRPVLPFWISSADSTAGHLVSDQPGDERWNVASGAMPRPLGRSPVMALGADRLYLGPATTYEILIFDLDGSQGTPIRKAVAPVLVTQQDIQAFLASKLAASSQDARGRDSARWSTVPPADTLPPYAAIVLDSEGNAWVQDYPRPHRGEVTWSVFDAGGRPTATIKLPWQLGILEIGTDWILGRYFDPEEGVPQVRLYRYRRASP